MIDPSALIELEGFERIDAAPGKALLRVRARNRQEGELPVVGALRIEAGERVQRVDPLPAPPDPDGLLRAAFPVPTELVDVAVGYALELADGEQIELPAPASKSSPRPPAAAPGGAGNRVTELESQLNEARAQAAALAATAEEAETRALTLEQVVRSESQRREELERAAQVAEQRSSADAERIRGKLAATREALHSAQEELRVAQLKLTQRPQAGEQSDPTELSLDLPAPEPRGVSLADQERFRRQRELSERRAAKQEARARARQSRIERRLPAVPSESVDPEAPQTGAAEPPPLERAEFEFTLDGLGRENPPAAGSFVERERGPSWLPSEATLGLVLVALGVLLAVLIVSGEIKLG